MKQLHPLSIWLFFMRYIPLILFLAATVNGFIAFTFSLTTKVDPDKVSIGTYLLEGFTRGIPLILVLMVPAFILAYIWARLSYNFYRYELAGDGFRKELGVIWKKYVTIPYDRIQNVDIYRGIWARILGLSDIHIQTAGMGATGKYGALSEGRLPGLSREIAEQLRDELIHRARQSKNQGL